MNTMPESQFFDICRRLLEGNIPCPLGGRIGNDRYRVLEIVADEAVLRAKEKGSLVEYEQMADWKMNVMPTLRRPGYRW